MRRFVGALLVGLGAIFAVTAIGLPLYVVPSVKKLPYDMQPCPPAPKAQPSGCLKPSVAEAKQAKFLQIRKVGDDVVIEVNTADLRSTTEVIPSAQKTADEQAAGRLTDDSVVWGVYSTVIRTDTKAVISASSTELALDRVSGAGVRWTGTWISESTDKKDWSIRYSEQIYKFPFGTEKRDYKYYDTDLRSAPSIKFEAVEQVGGIETYHFVQKIPDTAIYESADNIGVLLGKFAPGAKSGKIFYRNTREVWVDPATGAFVKVREQPHKELRPDTGPAVTLLQADFAYTPETTANSVNSAKDNGFLLDLVSLYLPITAGVLAVALIVGGLLLARRRPDSDDESFSDGLAPRRHRLQDDTTVTFR
jgi:Porin PorA